MCYAFSGVWLLLFAGSMFKGVTISGRELAKLREEKYFTQEELAGELEMSKGNIARIEALDVTGMQVKNFRRLAEMLKVTPDELRDRIGVGPSGARRVSVAMTGEQYARLVKLAGKRDVGDVLRDLAIGASDGIKRQIRGVVETETGLRHVAVPDNSAAGR